MIGKGGIFLKLTPERRSQKDARSTRLKKPADLLPDPFSRRVLFPRQPMRRCGHRDTVCDPIRQLRILTDPFFEINGMAIGELSADA